MSAIQNQDAANEHSASFDAEAAFADLFDASQKPSDAAEDEKKKSEKAPNDKARSTGPDDSDEAVQDESEDDATEGDNDVTEDGEDADEAEEDGKRYAEDDVFVKHVVDGEEREFSIRDLKRLAGQEASLTRKSQEAAEKRKALDEVAQYQIAAHEEMTKRAHARWEQFAKLDFALLATQLPPEEYQAVRDEAQAAYEDVMFFEQGLRDFANKLTETRNTRFLEAAQECVKVLSDPETGIKGWGDQVYREICTYAKDAGIADEVVKTLVDPAAFKLIHKAMLYDRAAHKIAKDKSAAKAKTPPKKIVKGTATRDATRKATDPASTDAAMKRLAKTGSRADAERVFLASWGVTDEG